MANINQLLKKIKEAIYGFEVRDTICEAIEQCYIDATNKNNSETEVALARGSYPTLKDRLDNMNTSSNNSFTLKNNNNVVPNINLIDNDFVECSEKISGANFTVGDINLQFNCMVSLETGDVANDVNLSYDNIKFIGDNCSDGELVLKSNGVYFIDFKYLKSNCLIGIVSSYCEGDEGNSNDVENEVIVDFTGADDIVNIGMTYFNAKDKYLTYGQTNVLTNGGTKSWSEVTVAGTDSTDGRYRNLDCSAFIGLLMRGISYNEIFLSQATYNNKDLSARTSTYAWASEPPRTAADILKFCEDNSWNLPKSAWHTDQNNSNWEGLKKGDLYFLGGSNNGRYKGVYHVGLFIGDYVASDGTHKICILDCTSNSGVAKHTDGKTKAVRILQFSKVPQQDIVAIVRIQG